MNLFHLFFLLLFTTRLFKGIAGQLYTLTFDPDYSPGPTIPSNYSARVYSIALGAITPKPLIAYLRLDGDIIKCGELGNAKFRVESLDENVKTIQNYNDTWLDTGEEQICQWGVSEPLPLRLETKSFRLTCGAEALEIRRGDRGAMVVDGLVHRNSNFTVPPNKRFYRITVDLLKGETVSADSELFEITEPAKYLNITQQPPATVVANHDFNMAVAVHGYDDQVLTVGTDSVLFAELQVAWEKETNIFFDQQERMGLLYSEKVRLSSPEAQVKQATFNTVVRKQLVNGRATFNNLRLLDVYDGVTLNVTVYQASFPWQRRPDVYNDLASIKVFKENDQSVFYVDITNHDDPAVVLTNPINVTAQRATQIQLLNNPHSKQCANCPIQPLLEVQLLDSANRLVTSGPDSELVIRSVASAGSQLSLDSSFTTKYGKGTFTGSISTISSNAVITFQADSIVGGSALAQAVTTSMQVTGELHFANFVDLKYSGKGTRVGPHIDTWVRYAKDDINQDRYGLLSGRTVVTHTYDTKDDIVTVIAEYERMMAMGKSDPSQKVLGVIGFGNNFLSERMQPWLTKDKVPQIATRDDKYEFRNKATYPYYSRISWDFGAVAHSTMLAAQSRHWTRTALFRDVTVEVSPIFYTKAMEMGINIIEIPLRPLTDNEFKRGVDAFSEEFAKLRQAGTKIVWIFVAAPLMYRLVRAASTAGITPTNGYQWLTVGNFTWHLPFENEHEFCLTRPICTNVLRGTNSFGAAYDLQGFRTLDWEDVFTRHVKRDRLDYHGNIAEHERNYLTAQFALGYDAMRVYAEAADYLINNNLTLSAENLVDRIRKVSFDGLTGKINLDANGNRVGYYGFLATVDPHPIRRTTPIIAVCIVARTLMMDSENSTSQVELINKALPPLDERHYTYIVNPYVLPMTPYLNKRRFNTSTGMVDESGVLVPIPPSTKPTKYHMKEEYTPAPFYCVLGCGGSQMDEFDIRKYAQGDCVHMNTCLCHDGYLGDTCEELDCDCGEHGHCDIPRLCICDVDWNGTHCEDPVCEDPCQQGNCTSPGSCTCEAGYVGANCGASVTVLIIVPLIIVIIFVIATLFFVIWFLRRHSLQQGLANLNWLVHWDKEVQIGKSSSLDKGDDEPGAQTNDVYFVKSNYVIWKSHKCYAQKFSADTLYVDDKDVRLEILQLKQLRHKNIVHFVGASLEYPDVAILTEFCQKGSLMDLLANKHVKLGWDFKYSLLKDICQGMDYLHRSVFISHGRLKSTNCLVDGKWTCKITGFGAPLLRYDAPRLDVYGFKETTSDSCSRDLFWTAPELLHHDLLDAVRSGTQAGDYYSFGIIVLEVITRQKPYTRELKYLDPEDIPLIVQNVRVDEDAINAKRKWFENGGDTSRPLRPRYSDSHMPEEYAARSQLRKLMKLNWSEDPKERLTFRENLQRLNKIHPVKGQLIENNVNMLMKYSAYLEEMLVGEIKELKEERVKTAEFFRQMLPDRVVEELKEGNTIEPESFDCVTLFFSDVVGFTVLARESSPQQVIDLLNDLYTTFDAILDSHDVYKVETIGDAYMVVSGLPKRNGNRHAGEIATVSLELLASVCSFKIRHMPGATLQLRIGMHSGPVVAGVVGVKFPRYVLFGETVNMASRMESTSMALRIHVSEATANILEHLGGFDLDCRGKRELRGKGKATTFWLLGKEGFTKPLPSRDLALTPSKHGFR